MTTHKPHTRRRRTLAALALGVFVTGALAGCGAKAPASQEKWKTYKTTPIIALDDTSSIWIAGGFHSIDGGTKIDYEYAVKNSDGSISQDLISNLHMPDTVDADGKVMFLDGGLGKIKIMQDATTETAHIDQRYCYWPGKHGLLREAGDCKHKTEVIVHVPPGTFKSNFNIDGPAGH